MTGLDAKTYNEEFFAINRTKDLVPLYNTLDPLMLNPTEEVLVHHKYNPPSSFILKLVNYGPLSNRKNKILNESNYQTEGNYQNKSVHEPFISNTNNLVQNISSSLTTPSSNDNKNDYVVTTVEDFNETFDTSKGDNIESPLDEVPNIIHLPGGTTDNLDFEDDFDNNYNLTKNRYHNNKANKSSSLYENEPTKEIEEQIDESIPGFKEDRDRIRDDDNYEPPDEKILFNNVFNEPKEFSDPRYRTKPFYKYLRLYRERKYPPSGNEGEDKENYNSNKKTIRQNVSKLNLKTFNDNNTDSYKNKKPKSAIEKITIIYKPYANHNRKERNEELDLKNYIGHTLKPNLSNHQNNIRYMHNHLSHKPYLPHNSYFKKNLYFNPYKKYKYNIRHNNQNRRQSFESPSIRRPVPYTYLRAQPKSVYSYRKPNRPIFPGRYTWNPHHRKNYYRPLGPIRSYRGKHAPHTFPGYNIKEEEEDRLVVTTPKSIRHEEYVVHNKPNGYEYSSTYHENRYVPVPDEIKPNLPPNNPHPSREVEEEHYDEIERLNEQIDKDMEQNFKNMDMEYLI